MASDAREREIALMEAEMIAATDAYFKARHPMLDTIDRRRVYEAGFKEAWNRRAPAPEVAGNSDREEAAWMSCPTRGPWVLNGLRERAKELHGAARKTRTAFNKDFMGEPSRYFAEVCAEAAQVFERHIAAIDAARSLKESP